MVERVGEKTREVLARGHRADRAGQDVVEQQRRYRELGQRTAHGLLHHAVHAAAHEHRAGLDVYRPHRVAEKHHGQHEPRRTLADHLLRIAANIVGRRRQVGEHDRGGPPEGDERQHHRDVATKTLIAGRCSFRCCRGHIGSRIPRKLSQQSVLARGANQRTLS